MEDLKNFTESGLTYPYVNVVGQGGKIITGN